MNLPHRKRRARSASPRSGNSGNILLAYYGDDFTGSTDVMEVLARAGLRTVLFLEPPTGKQLAKFPGVRAFGIAGGSRAMTPGEMDRELPRAFAALKASGAPIVHYKLCSTFDSSPQVGSIGKAIEIGRRVFGERPTPLVVGAPALGRYVVFGNLFARSGLDSEPFRLDRHPTMSRHPVTPMDEADLRLHLARQTRLPVELVDTLALKQASLRSSVFSFQGEQPPIVLFDTLCEANLAVIGREIARLAAREQLLVAGSSGVEYALVAHWKQIFDSGSQIARLGNPQTSFALPDRLLLISPPTASPKVARQIIAVSGSCSPVTDRQITRASEAGFVEIPLHVEHPAHDNGTSSVRPSALLDAQRAIAAGKSVALHTCRGSSDARVARRKKATPELSARIGRGLGLILNDLLSASEIRRAVVCGGDTSTHVARALGIEALEYLAPMAPGSPLCKVHAPGRAADGCEIVFKGGQVGRGDFFLDVLKGGPAPTNSES